MKPNLVIPMAGDGSRFSDAGYSEPKPLIKFLGKKMIQHVVDAFPMEANLIFIVRKDHDDEYNVADFLYLNYDCQVHLIDEKTEGSACTVLLVKDLINNDTPLFIMNSDNIVHWNPHDIKDADGYIFTFEDTDPKWSFAKTDSNGVVLEVQEKNPISTHATSGVYYWKKGSSFVQAANKMIADNFRVNNEFYTAPVYNWNINNGQIIYTVNSIMHSVGTPQDLKKYLQLNAL